MDPYQIENAFVYHPPKGEQTHKYELIRQAALGLAMNLQALCPQTSELERALYHLDEAVMLANAAIARHS